MTYNTPTTLPQRPTYSYWLNVMPIHLYCITGLRITLKDYAINMPNGISMFFYDEFNMYFEVFSHVMYITTAVTDTTIGRPTFNLLPSGYLGQHR